MSDPQTLAQTVQTTFQQILACLTSDPIPEGFTQQVSLYGDLRSKLGTKGVCEKLALKVEELPLLNKVVADVDRRSRSVQETDEIEARNLKISQLRLLGWLETIARRNPEAEIVIDVGAIVSEDMSRKRLRALELVIRSLVGERHSDQHALAHHLREIFGEPVVDKWLRNSDGNDALSGTTFSELASIFVNKQEFTHYDKLYDETPFLRLLREKRKTIQSFLEDIRRIRNALAHNKRVSDVQLELLDVYYDELMTPVSESHQKGETRVNPSLYLEVSDADLDDYFDNLHEDVMSVKDDIAELKSELTAKLQDISQQTATVRESTERINKKLILTIAAVCIVALIGVVAIYQNVIAKKDLNDVEALVTQIEEETGNIGESLGAVKADTAGLAESSKVVEDRTGRIEETAKQIAATGERLEEGTEAVREAVEKASERSEQSTATIREAVDKVAENSDRVVESLEAIRDGFKSLNKSGGIITEATTPQEIYHNARVYEQDGDYGKARQSYAKYFSYRLELIDPHLRYQSFLKLQEGREGARELYNELKARSPSLVAEYAALLLLNRDIRVKRLADFANEHAEFAPVFYELSGDYSEARLGDQAVSDKANELNYLRTFLKLHEEGNYLKYMLDQQLADSQLRDARERLEALNTVSEEALKNPVTLTAFKNNAGWMVNIGIVGPIKEMFYRKEGEEVFVSNGVQQQVNQTTGFPLPNLMIELEKDAPATKLFIKYIDTRDRVQGPYELIFDPDAELFRSNKDILERLSNSWLAFRDFDGKTLLYFSHLMSYRAALQEIRYGLDVDTPDRVYEFPAVDPDNPQSIGDLLPFIEVPATTRFATVQLKYKDGTESKIQRFKR